MSVLVIGLGSMACGKERRAVNALKYMASIEPFCLTSKWEDGSVGRLLSRNRVSFQPTSFGYLGRARLSWTAVNLVQMPLLWATVLRTFRKRRCSAVLILEMRSFANALVPVWWLKRWLRARLVFYLGDIPPADSPHRFLGRLINRWADAVVVNSEAVRDGLLRLGVEASKVQVVYNGAELNRFENAKPLDFRSRYGWSADSPVVAFAGQLSPNKGLLDFVEAAHRVLECRGDVRFVVMGKLDPQDPFHGQVLQVVKERRLEDRVVFCGWMEEMESAYAGVDLVVIPSRHEDPAPNVSIEAMASGVPVIATDVGGCRELVRHGETGLLVERARPGKMAEAVLQLLESQEARGRMGDAGKVRARQLFDIAQNARKVEEVLLHG